MAKEIKLMLDGKKVYEQVDAYVSDLLKNNHLTVKDLKEYFKASENMDDDDRFMADVKAIIKNDTRKYCGKLISPNTIFTDLYDTSLTARLMNLRNDNPIVVNNDKEHADAELSLFKPTEILDGMENVAKGNINDVTETGIKGAKMLVNQYKKEHQAVELQTDIRNDYELLASVNYVRAYNTFQYVLKETNKVIFGEGTNAKGMQTKGETLLVLDTQFSNMFFRTMQEIVQKMIRGIDLDDTIERGYNL